MIWPISRAFTRGVAGLALVLAGAGAGSMAVTGCGGGGARADHPAAPLPAHFKDMDLDQRVEFMKTVVLPRTRALFVAFDPRFSSMDCETCHGEGAKDGSWEMPNPKIKPLPGTEEAFLAWVQKEPEAGRWAQFMAEKLVPEMGRLLEVPVFDPRTHQGTFSCENCHVLVKPAAGSGSGSGSGA